MTFRELANLACAELPPGWEVRIELSREAGSVILWDPEGEDHEMELDGNITGAVLRAIEQAKEDDHLFVEVETEGGQPR